MKRTLWIAAWLSAAGLWFAASRADDLALAPRRGVLLLANGELIEGLITPAGDRYDVNLGDGEIHLKRSMVALAARDVGECYLFKRARIEVGRVQDHLDLAEWCMRHDLLSAAEKEVAAARAADATHPRIRLMQTRLDLAREAPPEKAPEPIQNAGTSTVQQQLDVAVRSLPSGAMESFTHTIQPMLLNYCAGSGCHGPHGEGTMPLERIGSNRRAGRKPTQRNLQRVLAMIDRASPQDSRLLIAPVQPHGTSKVPIFTDRQASQYRMLVQWVYAMARPEQTQEQPTLEERGAPLLQTVSRGEPARAEVEPPSEANLSGDLPRDVSLPSAVEVERAAARSEMLVPGDNVAAQRAPRALPVTPASEPAPLTRQDGEAPLRGVPRGERARPFVPKDAFDPAIFNRRFFGE